MTYYGLNDLREMFLKFYEERGHLRLPSFPLIPQGDKSLLLINSGMAPMKPWFTGEQEPPSKRVTTCQKCIRTGDIENVGKTSRHGTYFEMLGNFSFGDYFKEEALTWYWEFLTKTVGIDEELLYPSVYEEDDEAYNIWRDKIGIPPERICRLGRDDNFWDHGSGPCGPCSEVYFDRGAENGCGSPDCAPGCDCDRFIEVGNNVFSQFSNDGSNNYTELSQKNIDFGGGLERLAVICQGVDSLFDVDTIMKITNKVSELTGRKYGQSHDTDVSLRIITDHIRSATMMTCDGVLPSNEGRGYVLRRLLRRAARHGRMLGAQGSFLSEVCLTVIEENEGAYPDLREKSGYITRVISVEEENFSKTIDTGISILSGLISQYTARGESLLSGADAFKLYDTYGFPIDLTIEIIAEQGLSVDSESFNEHMDEQRKRARKAREALGDLAWASSDLGLDVASTVFTGYEAATSESLVLAIVAQGESSAVIRSGDTGILVLDRTPFYAEMGGQVSDFGTITLTGAAMTTSGTLADKPGILTDMSVTAEETSASAGKVSGASELLSAELLSGESASANHSLAQFDVTGVHTDGNGKYLHHGTVRSGEFNIDDRVIAAIDVSRRQAVMRAHSATHLLHSALRAVLGDHVAQAGSLVEPDKLRFDFTHFAAMTSDELEEVQRIVNDDILSGLSVTVDEMPIANARELGATALFGEKYGDIVRVVRMGDESTELCGGTHLDNTAKAGAFHIVSEFSVASGVRRIEATTGKATLQSLDSASRSLSVLGGMLKANTPEDITGKLEQNISLLRELRSSLEAAVSREARSEAARILSGARKIGGLHVIATLIEDANVDIDRLRMIEDALKDWEAGVVAVFAVVKDGKITVMAACGKAAVEKGVKAGDIVREVTKICGGSGGGKPDFAMGGGKDLAKLRDAIDVVDKLVQTAVGE